MKKNWNGSAWVWLALGAGLYTLVTWKWNVAAAAWLAPLFLMRFFRAQKRWYATLPAVALIWAGSYANKTGAWGMDPWLEVVLLGVATLPLVAALYADRLAARRLRGFWVTLIFPSAFVAVDYAISFMPVGTSLALAPSQFYFQALIQVAALVGIWGIEFLVLWTAPVFNALWEAGFNLPAVRRTLGVYVLCLAAVLVFGGLRIVFARPTGPTVPVAGVTVAHVRPYWDELIDKGTPADLARGFANEFQALEDQLFAQSETAARAGAKVIFWSEADAFILPERQAAFFQRARDFARQHQVYLMPAYQTLRYGDTSGLNGLAMITPAGEVAYEYEKTMTWYATTSDGILHAIDTPYGRIGAAICFDFDFPDLIRQAARQNVDIMLVPAYDTYLTRVYHTEVGLLRAVDYGFSVARMVNEGTSIAVDYRGQVLAAQDFFTTPQRIMSADLPTSGTSTLYTWLGDGLAWLCTAYAVIGVGWGCLKKQPQPGV